jgi:hypothetical protein
MSNIKIPEPESFLFYLEDRNNVAMELLGQEEEPLPILTWEEVGKFYQAKFPFEATKYEIYMFLRELWEIIWYTVLRVHSEFEPTKSEDNYPGYYYLNRVFDSKTLQVIHKYHNKYSLGTAIERIPEIDQPQFRLYFWFESPAPKGSNEPTYKISDDLVLLDNLWKPLEEDDAHNRYSLVLYDGDIEKLSELQKSAEEAISKLLIELEKLGI